MALISPDSVLVSPSLPSCWPRFSQPLKLGVLASGRGTNLEAISASIQRQELHATIQVVIYNNPGAGVVDRARGLGLPSVLLNHRHYPSREALDLDIIQTLATYQANWVIMAGWMRCVTQVLIEAFPRQVLNIHPSLLPSFPGTHAVDQALAAGVKLSGCTVHHVEIQVDRGPIIIQAGVPVYPQDSVAALQARIQAQEYRIYPAAIALAALDRANLVDGKTGKRP